jgi:predicted nuclease of predicted toxin-antitoxin system
MNLVADESIDGQIVYRLQQDGHLVHYVVEMKPGIPDDAVLDLANREAALLLTVDKDFGELVYRQGRITSGIVLVRLAGLSPTHKADIVSSTLRKRRMELRHAFTVITPGTVRLRRPNR